MGHTMIQSTLSKSITRNAWVALTLLTTMQVVRGSMQVATPHSRPRARTSYRKPTRTPRESRSGYTSQDCRQPARPRRGGRAAVVSAIVRHQHLHINSNGMEPKYSKADARDARRQAKKRAAEWAAKRKLEWQMKYAQNAVEQNPQQKSAAYTRLYKVLLRKGFAGDFCDPRCLECKGAGILPEAVDVCQNCQGTGSPIKEEILQNYKEIVEYSNHWPGWAFTRKPTTERDHRNDEWKKFNKATMLMYRSPDVLIEDENMNVKSVKITEPDIKMEIGKIMKDNIVDGGQFPGWPTMDLVKTLLKKGGLYRYINPGKLQEHMNHVKRVCTKDFCVKKNVPEEALEFPKAKDVPSSKRFRNKSELDPTTSAAPRSSTRKSRHRRDRRSRCNMKIGGKEHERTQSMVVSGVCGDPASLMITD